jgi:hypothetical protein
MNAVVLPAMLLGLCAEVMASPLNWLLDNYRPDSTAFDDPFVAPVIEQDLDFYYSSVHDAFVAGDQNQANASVIDVNETSDSLRLPDGPPLPIIAAGLGCIGILVFVRREQRKVKRKARRRRLGIRPITAGP